MASRHCVTIIFVVSAGLSVVCLVFPVPSLRPNSLYDLVLSPLELSMDDPFFPQHPQWWTCVPHWFRCAYSSWWALKQKYLDFWGNAFEDHCKKSFSNKTCCDAVVDLAESVRWKIYLVLVAAFSVGVTIFYLGRFVKPSVPSYWSVHLACLPRLFDKYKREVDVTSEMSKAVQDLFDLTTGLMGKGHDGSWVKHKRFRVVKVVRLEHGNQWTIYQNAIRSMRPISSLLRGLSSDEQKKVSDSAAMVRGCMDRWASSSPKVASMLKQLKLDRSRNEALLFHGAPRLRARDPETGAVRFEHCSPLDAIMRRGFDDRLGNTSGMLGSGIYFADMVSKADQYAGKYGLPEETTVGEEANIFLVRVTLGCIYETNVSLNQMRRPPCLHGHFDAALAWSPPPKPGFGAKPWAEKGVDLQMCDHPRCNSVVSNRIVDERPRAYREYAIYGRHAYPEFCVTYRRE